MSTLSTVLGACGVDAAVVRTSMSRLAQEGWVVRERRGRNSFYALTPMAQQQSQAASRRIYASAHLQAPCGWYLYLIHDLAADERRRARALFARYGAGTLGSTVHILPDTILLRDKCHAQSLPVSLLPPEQSRKLVRDAFTLDRLASDYKTYDALWTPVLTKIEAGYNPSQLEALALRILSLHLFRRIILRDPDIPTPYLPDNWPGFSARATAGCLWLSLFSQSELWLDANALCIQGQLPPRTGDAHSFREPVRAKNFENSQGAAA